MQQFACIESPETRAVYQPLHGFTAVDLGHQRGNAISNFVTKLDESTMAGVYPSLFDQIWRDKEKLGDVSYGKLMELVT